jgi:hypothetical protein
MPVTARAEVARRWPLAIRRPKTRHDALRGVMRIELIGRTQMRFYFPDSVLRAERVFGLTKSLIAYRGTGS